MFGEGADAVTSPYSSGGGGFRFEDRVAAYYLASLLTESAARGLIGTHPAVVMAQRAELGHPLDDIIIEGVTVAGDTSRLSIQLKSKLTFTAGDDEWTETVRRAWVTVNDQGFNSAFDRVGVAMGTLTARADSHYRPVLTWARYSASGEDFVRRVQQPDFSHKDRTAFVDNVRRIIAAELGRDASDDEVWRLLRSFVILHFDFLSDASSGDAASILGQLQSYFSPADRPRAPDVWNYLAQSASTLIPAAGSLDRDRLLELLAAEGLPAGVAPSRRGDIAKIDAESRQALAEIRCDIGGLRLHRLKPVESIFEVADGRRFIQLVSEPGAGKSAILRELAEQRGQESPLFVLKNDRIHPRGWAAHASTLSVTSGLADLLNELAAAGNPTVFIDGIDRVADAPSQVTVNDILRAIIGLPAAEKWTVVVTVREQNLRHLETWLDRNALDVLGVRTVRVDPLSEDEQEVVANAFPRLRPLLRQGGGMDVVLSRPFFLDTILRLADNQAAAGLPASEVQLLDLWWRLGGSDRQDFAQSQRRRDTLIALASAAAAHPNSPLPIHGLDPDALDELRNAGVVRDQSFGHTVNFAHDIYEEWSLCHLLRRNRQRLPDFLRELGEPQALVRAAQLLGSQSLESDLTSDDWQGLLADLDAPSLRPVWYRAVATAPLHSTQTVALLNRVETYLLANDAAVLRKLLLALRTIEVVPNPVFFDAEQIPDVSMEERVKMAQLAALPKAATWVRFMDWLMPRLSSLPGALVPHLLPALQTWQSAFGGYGIRHCRAIGEVAYDWLREFEEAVHPDSFEHRRRPFGIRFSHDDERKIEKSLRSLLLSSPADAPDAVRTYLAGWLANRRRLHLVSDEIIKGSAQLAVHLPAELVDFILTVCIDVAAERRARRGWSYDEDGIDTFGMQVFYPESPLQMPFLPLLRHHPEEGLRLIHGLTDAATRRWRERMRRAGWTPIPITLTLPWGRQRFWGDAQAYQWFRGASTNHAVGSGLMALEQWALERLDRGDEFGEVFEDAIRGCNSVAMLGIGVSLSLAAQGKSVPTSFALVKCLRLWQWDIGRFVQDHTSMPANEIGNWNTDRHYLQAVRKLNQRPHRQNDIRVLNVFYIFAEDRRLAGRFARAVRAWPRRLPFEVEEQRQHPDSIAELTKRAIISAQQAEPDNWSAVPTADGKHIELRPNLPYLEQEDHKEQIAAQAQVQRHMSFGMWAHTAVDKGELEPRFDLNEAIAEARRLYAPDVFEIERTQDDDYEDSHPARMRAAAVAGVAYIAARHQPDIGWSDELAAWCLDVFERAATTPEPLGSFGGRQAALLMSPSLFAAYGYSALLARGVQPDGCRRALLNLAADSLEQVAAGVFKASAYYAAAQPDFLWLLVDLALRQCIFVEGNGPDYHSLVWTPQEAERQLELIERAEEHLSQGTLPTFPDIPMPWLPLVAKPSQRDDYRRNEVRFFHHLAEKTVLQAPVEILRDDPRFAPDLIDLAAQLLEHTGSAITGPWATSRRSYRHESHENTPFEWVFAFSHWCGRLCAHLPEKVVAQRFLAKIFAWDDETGLLVMQPFMLSFMLEAFVRPKEIDGSNLRIWGRMTDWIFEHPQWSDGDSDRHLGREYQGCMFATLFCAAPDFGPLICGIEPGWKHLSTFLPTVERAVRQFGRHQMGFWAVGKFLQAGGIDLFPEPALGWLREISVALKSDEDFWEHNGDLLVDLLKQALKDRGPFSGQQRQDVILIADILVDNGVRGAGFLQQELCRTEFTS